MLFYLYINIILISEVFGESNSQPCTYFGDEARFSSPQGNLINCSWYSSNACCRRTEVTSVFSGMYPLYKSSKTCQNMINYLMCYFCSPQQFNWYVNNQARICSKFCDDIYRECAMAEFEANAIHAQYSNGEEFCNGQRFEFVDGNSDCFNYDPTVFGQAVPFTNHFLILILCCLLSLFFIVTTN